MQQRGVVALSTMAFLGACSIDQSTAPVLGEPSDALAVVAGAAVPTGVHLVRFAPAAEQAARAAVTARGGQVLRTVPELGLWYVSGLDQVGATSLQSTAGIASMVADHRTLLRPAPARASNAGNTSQGPAALGTDQSNAPFFPFQWNMRSTRANAAWVPSGGGAGKLVCVLDTGIDPDHIDINGRIAPGRAISMILNPRYPSDATALDFDFHGTFVAALITSNGAGMASTAPNARLCAIKVLSQDGQGTFGDVIAGIVQAANWNADVINLSLGAVLDVAEPVLAALAAQIQAAVTYAVNRGSLVVAAAGNAGVNFDELPRRYINVPSMLGGVVSVGATAPINQSNFDLLASYSNFGGARTLDLVAPGGDFVVGGVSIDLVLSACSQFASSLPFACSRLSYVLAAGTSFAAPMVSGAGAVVESTKGPMSPASLEACLLNTADRVGPRWMFGAGRLNVLSALTCP